MEHLAHEGDQLLRATGLVFHSAIQCVLPVLLGGLAAVGKSVVDELVDAGSKGVDIYLLIVLSG